MTTTAQALIPNLISKNGNKVSQNIFAVVSGTLLLALLAQISFHLPFTPVPVTGQTFGVIFISLLWGRSRGVAAVISYLTLGILGVPVFAFGTSMLALGATSGYLVGMLVAAYLMGTLADLGWTKNLSRTLVAAFAGTAVTFVFGVLVLSLFVPTKSLFMMGVAPFILGDVLKVLIASTLVQQIQARQTQG